MAFQKVDQLDFQISLAPWHGQSFPDWSFWALIKWVLWLLSNSISSKIHARISLFSFPQTTNQIKGTKFAAKYRFSTTNSFPHVYFGLFLSTMRFWPTFWVHQLLRAPNILLCVLFWLCFGQKHILLSFPCECDIFGAFGWLAGTAPFLDWMFENFHQFLVGWLGCYYTISKFDGRDFSLLGVLFTGRNSAVTNITCGLVLHHCRTVSEMSRTFRNSISLADSSFLQFSSFRPQSTSSSLFSNTPHHHGRFTFKKTFPNPNTNSLWGFAENFPNQLFSPSVQENFTFIATFTFIPTFTFIYKSFHFSGRESCTSPNKSVLLRFKTISLIHG